MINKWDLATRLATRLQPAKACQTFLSLWSSRFFSFSVLFSRLRRTPSSSVGIRPSFSHSTRGLRLSFFLSLCRCQDFPLRESRSRLLVHCLSPPLRGTAWFAATRKRRLRHCGGAKGGGGERGRGTQRLLFASFVIPLIFLPAFSSGTFFFHCSASSSSWTERRSHAT